MRKLEEQQGSRLSDDMGDSDRALLEELFRSHEKYLTKSILNLNSKIEDMLKHTRRDLKKTVSEVMLENARTPLLSREKFEDV